MKIEDIVEKLKTLNLELVSDLSDKLCIDTNTKFTVKNKYGILEVTYNKLVNSRTIGIAFAQNKTEYFKNIAKDLHNNCYDYSLSMYKGSTTHIKIICPIHGEFKQSYNQHVIAKKGCYACGKKRRGAVTTLIADNKYKELCKKYNFTFIKRISENNCSVVYYKGLYNLTYRMYVKSDTVLLCTLTTVQDKTKFFIEEAKRITGDKYNYEYVIYTGNKEHVLLECNDCNYIFERTPNDLLSKNPDCYHCALLKKHFIGFSRSNFINLCNKNNTGKATLYIIHCFDDTEDFYKIGITSRSVGIRFQYKHYLPYNYEITQEIEDDADVIWDLEKYLHNLYKDYSYKPLKSFGGKTECFLMV